jgi:hypothetical protein
MFFGPFILWVCRRHRCCLQSVYTILFTITYVLFDRIFWKCSALILVTSKKGSDWLFNIYICSYISTSTRCSRIKLLPKRAFFIFICYIVCCFFALFNFNDVLSSELNTSFPNVQLKQSTFLLLVSNFTYFASVSGKLKLQKKECRIGNVTNGFQHGIWLRYKSWKPYCVVSFNKGLQDINILSSVRDSIY